MTLYLRSQPEILTVKEQIGFGALVVEELKCRQLQLPQFVPGRGICCIFVACHSPSLSPLISYHPCTAVSHMKAQNSSESNYMYQLIIYVS